MVCPFSNTTQICRADCALAVDGKCAFTVIAQNISVQNQDKTEKKDQA